MAFYISSPQFSPRALNWIYCPNFFPSSFFLSPSFMWLIGLILTVQIEVCQSCENGQHQRQQNEERDKVWVGFSGVLKENLQTHRRHSQPRWCINGAAQWLAPPRSYTYLLDSNIFADGCFQCVTRYVFTQLSVKCFCHKYLNFSNFPDLSVYQILYCILLEILQGFHTSVTLTWANSLEEEKRRFHGYKCHT